MFTKYFHINYFLRSSFGYYKIDNKDLLLLFSFYRVGPRDPEDEMTLFSLQEFVHEEKIVRTGKVQ